MTARQKMAMFIHSLVLAVALTIAPVVLVTGTIALTSCSSTPTTIVYNTLKAVADGVDTSMKIYTDLLVQGKIDQQTQVMVFNAKTRYEVAFAAAVTAARGNLSSPSPADVQSLADSLKTIITAITGK